MSAFVVGGDTLLLDRKDMRLSLGAKHDLLYAPYKVVLGNHLPLLTGSQDCSLVYKTCQVGTREAGGAFGNNMHIYILKHGYLAGMDVQYLLPIFEVRQVQNNAPIKTSRAQEGRVQDVWPVGGRHHDHLV